MTSCETYNIDVCVVIETFLNNKVPDTYVWIDGFSIFRRDRQICRCRKSECTKQHGGGGILIYTRSWIECEYYSVSTSAESLWIKLQSQHSCPIFINASYPSSIPHLARIRHAAVGPVSALLIGAFTGRFRHAASIAAIAP